jgi:hypothetical protein
LGFLYDFVGPVATLDDSIVLLTLAVVLATYNLIPGLNFSKFYFAREMADLINAVHSSGTIEFHVDFRYLGHAFAKHGVKLTRSLSWEYDEKNSKEMAPPAVGSLPQRKRALAIKFSDLRTDLPKWALKHTGDNNSYVSNRIADARNELMKMFGMKPCIDSLSQLAHPSIFYKMMDPIVPAVSVGAKRPLVEDTPIAGMVFCNSNSNSATTVDNNQSNDSSSSSSSSRPPWLELSRSGGRSP